MIKFKNKWQLTLLSFLLALILVSIFIFIFKPPKSDKYKDLYVTVKLNQGVWWSISLRPGIWFLNGLKKGDYESDLFNQKSAEIVSVRYYQQQDFENINKFDMFIVLKLKATITNNQYFYKRTNLLIGAPINFYFKKTYLTGTIINISENLDNRYIEKIVKITKKQASPWEFDIINIGDKFFDGEDNVVEVIDKKTYPVSLITTDFYGANSFNYMESRQFIEVTLKVKFKINDKNQYIFGEEQVIKKGDVANFATNNMIFVGYSIADIY